MHDHYQATQTPKVSYSLYSKVVNKCNISFVRLGNEQCETCTAAIEHKKQVEQAEHPTDCTLCPENALHVARYTAARIAYTADGDSILPGEVVFAVDLQKVSTCNHIIKEFIFILVLIRRSYSFLGLKDSKVSFSHKGCWFSMKPSLQ